MDFLNIKFRERHDRNLINDNGVTEGLDIFNATERSNRISW